MRKIRSKLILEWLSPNGPTTFTHIATPSLNKLIAETESKDSNLYQSQLDHLPGSVSVWGGGNIKRKKQGNY